MEDSVAVDAKRILLRYGVPVVVLDKIDEAERIALARELSRTPVPDRGHRLQDLLVEKGYLDADTVAATRTRKSRRKK